MKPFPRPSNSKSIYKQQALVFGLALVVSAPPAKSGINLKRCFMKFKIEKFISELKKKQSQKIKELRGFTNV